MEYYHAKHIGIQTVQSKTMSNIYMNVILHHEFQIMYSGGCQTVC
jgi:hypothetical protein